MLDTETVAAWLRDFAEAVHEKSAWLTDLDRQIGDADHGSNMDRGCTALAALDPADFADAASMLKKAGMLMVSTVGGAAGPLFGTFLLRVASTIGPDGPLDAARFGRALHAGLDGVVARGKASEGDKTMVDALTAALRSYDGEVASGASGHDALSAAARAAAAGRDATADLVARKGRASYLGERSRGHMDPGAASMTLLLESAARTLG